MLAQNGRLRLETSLGKGSLLSGDRMANGGWKNADAKM